MLLAVDVGNTQTDVGLHDGGRWAHRFRLSTHRDRTPDEYSVLLRALLQQAGVSLGTIAAAAMASVVPPLTTLLREMFTDLLGFAPLVVEPGVRTGMPVHYESPRDVGADRIVNGVAAYERFRGAPDGPSGVLVVDFGTAITLDVISPRGEYLGGAIAPGVAISTEALFTRASKLPRVELVAPAVAIGRSTVQSMQSGIVYGYAALVDGVVGRMLAELDFVPRVIATGAHAALVGGLCEAVHAVDDLLTLEGLRLIHGRNAHGGGR